MDKITSKKSFYAKQKTKKENADEYHHSINKILLYKNRRNLFFIDIYRDNKRISYDGKAQKIMKNNYNTRLSPIHLYNPKEEGLGSYDFHYINAYKKNNRIKLQQKKRTNERYAA